MTVYFAQPANGGPIKVGSTGDIRSRMTTLGAWIPGGVEVLATIAGDAVREEALKYALRAFRIQGEWVKSCVPVWRLIDEAATSGDIAWLPGVTLIRGEGAQRFAETLRLSFGSRAAAAKALGLSVGAIPPVQTKYTHGYLSAVVQGRAAYVLAERAGAVPDWLTAASAQFVGERAPKLAAADQRVTQAQAAA